MFKFKNTKINTKTVNEAVNNTQTEYEKSISNIKTATNLNTQFNKALIKHFGWDIMEKLELFGASTIGSEDETSNYGKIIFPLDRCDVNYIRGVAMSFEGFPIFEFVRIQNCWFRVDTSGLAIKGPTVFPFIKQNCNFPIYLHDSYCLNVLEESCRPNYEHYICLKKGSN